jgi:hypothetical protein
MYQEGTVVRRDLVLAHMWANLAAAQGIRGAGTMRLLIEEKMTPAQILEAQKMAGEWKSKPEGPVISEVGAPGLR